MKALEWESRELRRPNEVLRKAPAYFCDGGARTPIEVIVGFIDAHRSTHGVEPVYSIADRDPARFQRELSGLGMRKVWRQLRGEGFDVARCTVGRLMKDMGIQGIVRGKPNKMTIPNKKKPRPLEKVNRQFGC